MTALAQLERPVAQDKTLADSHPKVLILRHLIAAMMMGQWHGCDSDVATILKALSHALGDPRQLSVNLALASALRGDTGPARRLLAEDLDDWPAPDQARLTLSLALKVGGDDSWAEEPTRILAVSNEPEVREYAARVMQG